MLMNIPLAADVCNSAAVSCMNYMINFKHVNDYATVNLHRCATYVQSIKESASETLSIIDINITVGRSLWRVATSR